jgi:protein TonB
MSRDSLPWALLLSLVLHGLLLAPQGVGRLLRQSDPAAALARSAARLETRLEARLELPLPPLPASPEVAHAPLLKDTLAEPTSASARSAQPRSVLRPSPLLSPRRAQKPEALQAAQRKLARHVYYPPEAVAQGLEGEVRLLLSLAEDGRILAVSVAVGSGSPLLDHAALEAALAMGRIADVQGAELLLPVVFRLQ